MDILGTLLEVLFSVAPIGVACGVLLAASSLVWALAHVWHGHEQSVLTICNSAEGRIGQLFNGSATANCGISSLLSKAAWLLEAASLLVALASLAGLIVFAIRGELGKRLEV